MILYGLMFLLGDMYLQSLSDLPRVSFSIISAIIAIAISTLLKRWTRWHCLALFAAAGFFYAAWSAYRILSWSLPQALEDKPVIVTGIITSLISQDSNGRHFTFQMQTLVDGRSNLQSPSLIRLSWANTSIALMPGDSWQLMVRMRRIHGMENPGGVDMEKWALTEHLRAAGVVVDSKYNHFLSHRAGRSMVLQWRQSIKKEIETALSHSPMLPWVLALAIGDRTEVKSEDWEILRKTGTNHLMAIAGLHIGLLAAVAAKIAGVIWRRYPAGLMLLPAMDVEAIVALLAGVTYAMLAGFSIPARRASLMLLIFVAVFICRRRMSIWIVWILALSSVLLMDPFAVLTDSFWLSFGTIALVIYGMHGRLRTNGFWWKWCRIQWVIGFGLIPFSLYFYRECSIISFAANCVAIPFLGMAVLPFVLLGVLILPLFPSFSYCLWRVAAMALHVLWKMLTVFAVLPVSAITLTVPGIFYLITGIIAVVLLLLPTGQPGRWLGVVWCLPIFLYMPPRPLMGDVWLTVLDVGQGLSVVVKTHAHTLVYDAGPALNDRMNAGENILVPYLQLDRRRVLDALVISHGDNDHIGGANAVLKAFTVRRIFTSVPDKMLSPVTAYCLRHTSWQWDGVTFSFLYPTSDMLNKINDSSCVLRIKSGSRTILLPGDIEKTAETALLSNQVDELQSTILIAPHHGSKTSGMPAFVRTVFPLYVVYAVGYHNRFQFPHTAVTSLYADIQSTQLSTTKTGALTFRLESRRPLLLPERFRQSHLHYWSDSAA